MSKISIIIPTINEANNLPLLLSDLSSIQTEGEIIIVDCGSEDKTVDIANIYGCLLYTSPSPRDQSGSRMPSSA